MNIKAKQFNDTEFIISLIRVYANNTDDLAKIASAVENLQEELELPSLPATLKQLAIQSK